MNLRQERIEAQLEQLKSQSNLQVMMCEPDDIIRNDLWIVWINGSKGTLYENAVYPVKITFPEKYPLQPPIVQFQPNFLHIHVYEGGLICLPLLEQVNWRSKVTGSQVIRRIDSLIHQEINPYSPANMPLFQIYKDNYPQYQKIIREQAQKYKQKKLSYFVQPSCHIQIITSKN